MRTAQDGKHTGCGCGSGGVGADTLGGSLSIAHPSFGFHTDRRCRFHSRLTPQEDRLGTIDLHYGRAIVPNGSCRRASGGLFGFPAVFPAADSTLGLRLKRIDWGQSIYTLVEPFSPMAPAFSATGYSSNLRGLRFVAFCLAIWRRKVASSSCVSSLARTTKTEPTIDIMEVPPALTQVSGVINASIA